MLTYHFCCDATRSTLQCIRRPFWTSLLREGLVMSAVSYTSPKFVRTVSASAEPKKGFFARVLEAIIAARTEQAELEVLKYVQRTGRYPLL